MTRPVSLLAALLTATVLALIPAGANAEDRRPCVSKVEYREAPGAIRVVMRGQTALDRRALERFWDVRGLGVVDPESSDARSTLWMYPACGYSFDEAQVWVVTTGRNGAADVMARWVAPWATRHGHV